MDAALHDVLERIASALDRLAPAASGAATDAPVARWQGGSLSAVQDFAPVALDLLTGIDAQKAALVENGRRLAQGVAAHDALLWGARGTGKSALVKASVAALQAEGHTLALIEASGSDCDTLPALFALLATNNRPTIVFVDDLGFEANGDAARHLRSLLDGGVAARPAHVRLYVTSNRRHILPRNLDEQASAINPRDAADDNLALADRFGLRLGFHVCDQDAYLAMVARYAAHFGLSHDPADALKWATQRGARSGRVAWHFIVDLAGRTGKSLR